jgi:hypothetical protein
MPPAGCWSNPSGDGPLCCKCWGYVSRRSSTLGVRRGYVAWGRGWKLCVRHHRMRAQRADADLRQREHRLRRNCLGRAQCQVAIDPLQLPAHPCLTRSQVNLRPSEPEKLTATQSEDQEQDVTGVQRIVRSSDDSRKVRASSTVQTFVAPTAIQPTLGQLVDMLKAWAGQ